MGIKIILWVVVYIIVYVGKIQIIWVRNLIVWLVGSSKYLNMVGLNCEENLILW